MKLVFANVRTISELAVLEMGLGNGICDIWKRGKWIEHWGTGRKRGTWNCQSSELSGGGFDWNLRTCDGCFFTSGLWLGGQTYAGCVRLTVNPLLLGDVNRPPPAPGGAAEWRELHQSSDSRGWYSGTHPALQQGAVS